MTSRELHLYYRDGHSRLEVLDSDKQTVLYVVYRTSSKPHLTICRAPTHKTPERMVGQVSFHHFSSAIDLNMVDGPVTMKKQGMLSSTYNVSGEGIRWKWERDGALTSNLKLVDEMGGRGVLATFENASWSVKKQGKLLVRVEGGWEWDVAVVTGLAKVEYQRRSQSTQNGAINASVAAGGS